MTALHLAGPQDLDRLLPLVATFLEEQGQTRDEAALHAAIAPLLEGSPHGAAYLVGPQRAPIGYVILGFGWSVAAGGLEAVVDQVFIRPGVRRRGLGTEVLLSLPKALGSGGVRAVHAVFDRENERLVRFFTRLHFKADQTTGVMTRVL